MAHFFSLLALGLSGSSSQNLQTWLDAMQVQFPGYNPSQASLEYIQAQIIASLAADVSTQASNGATELFRTFGTTLVRVPYQSGVAAQAVITVTAQANPNVLATVSSNLSVAGPIVSIPVIQLTYGISAGTFTLTDPGLLNSQTWTTSGASPGDTAIPVTSQVPSFAFPSGSTIGPPGTSVQIYEIQPLTQWTLDSLGFQNLGDYVINAGAAQQVSLTAVQAGLVFNGAGSGGNAQSVQLLPWATTIAVFTAAANGQDPEDDDHYLDRLTTALQLQAPRPITATDYGTMALNFNPFPGTDQQEVGRATSIDGYNTSSGLVDGTTRSVLVAVTDANGFALNNDTLYGYPNGTSSNIVTAVPNPNSGWGIAGWLLSLRELNFLVTVVSPTYSTIFVQASVKASDGYDAVTVQQNVQASLLTYLSPSGWGLPPLGQTGWANTTVIRQSAILGIIQNTPGVQYILVGTLAFGFAASPSNTTDLTLPGNIALPISSVLSVPLSAITVA